MGIYIHIPFCKKRCIYCDFYSTTFDSLKESYINALLVELQHRKAELGDEPIHTVYLGGGTPSQLTIQNLERLLLYINKVYVVTPDAEITMECNPDDLTPKYIDGLRHLPINRLSLGIQTFDDARLQFLNRRHTAEQAVQAVKRCQEAGFGNISIDLIYGFPGETADDWNRDLDQALHLGIQHLSAYNLIYEEGTPLYRLYETGKASPLSDEEDLKLFDMLIERTHDAGFEHYEVSNFALPGFHSRHNSSYWEGIPYLGLGAGAHSFDGSVRRHNNNDVKNYIQTLCAKDADETRVDAPHTTENLSDTNRYNERILTAIRTYKGLNLNDLKKDFGSNALEFCLKAAQPYIAQKKLLHILPEREGQKESPLGILRLSREGLFISDLIMSDLMMVDD